MTRHIFEDILAQKEEEGDDSTSLLREFDELADFLAHIDSDENAIFVIDKYQLFYNNTKLPLNSEKYLPKIKVLFLIVLTFGFKSALASDALFNLLKENASTDSDDTLSYPELFEHIDSSAITLEQAREIVNHGHYYSPLLFFTSTDLIEDADYSLNFLWVHKEKLVATGHFFGDDFALLQQNIINPLQDWRSMQPTASINYWYDGELVTEAQIQATKDILRRTSLGDSVVFRNLREIPLVKQNRAAFEQNLPVYFRVDFAKALVGDHVLRNDNLSYAINIDLDIPGVTKAQLFDHHTVFTLKNVGIVTAFAENSFIMLSNLNGKLLAAHKETLIDSVLDRIGWSDPVFGDSVFPFYNLLICKCRMKYREQSGAQTKMIRTNKPMLVPHSSHGSRGYGQDSIDVLRPKILPVTMEGRAFSQEIPARQAQ